MAAHSPLPASSSLSHTLQLMDRLWLSGNVLGRQGAAVRIAGIEDGLDLSALVSVCAGGGGGGRQCACEGGSGLRAESEKGKAREKADDARVKLKGEKKEQGEQAGESMKIKKAENGVDLSVGLHQQKLASLEVKENGHNPELRSASQKKTDQFISAAKIRLETINSGKLLLTEAKSSIPLKRRQRCRWRKRNKSLTDLEYDELKGIRDLGFNFSEDELTPGMISLVPGLKSYGKQSTESTSLQAEATRLYPSADWWISKTESPLQNWQIPDPQREGIDMKEQLKFWARAVASTVRQEC